MHTFDQGFSNDATKFPSAEEGNLHQAKQDYIFKTSYVFQQKF